MREHFLVTVTFYFERKSGTSTYATIKAKETLRLSLSAYIGEPDEIKAFCSTVCFCLGCRELLVDFGASVSLDSVPFHAREFRMFSYPGEC